MKNTALILMALLWGFPSIGQSITPTTTTPQCPNVPIPVTVTMTGPSNATQFYDQGISLKITNSNGSSYNTMAPNATTTPTSVVFNPANNTWAITFNVTFADNSTPQSISVWIGTGTPANFTFTEIESFNGHNLLISPTPTSITAPRCTITPYALSFPQITYVNNGPFPAATYGTITNYSYVLPSGWKMVNSAGTTVTASGNPVTPITGGHSTTVTSDLADGAPTGVITITPLNSCNIGYAQGATVPVSISRPQPSINITTNDGTLNLCSGTKTFTLNGTLPTGATIAWTSDAPGAVTVPANSSGTSVVGTYVGAGVAHITATVTDCISSYSTSVTLSVGPPTGPSGITSLNNLSLCPNDGYTILIEPYSGTPAYAYYGTLVTTSNAQQPNVTYLWVDEGSGANFYWADNGGGSITVGSKYIDAVGSFYCKMTNVCGTANSYPFTFVSGDCSYVNAVNPKSGTLTTQTSDGATGSNTIGVYPNPVQGSLNVTLPDTIDLQHTEIRVTNLQGKEIHHLSSVSTTNNISMQGQAPGLYVINVYTNKKLVASKKILKQ